MCSNKHRPALMNRDVHLTENHWKRGGIVLTEFLISIICETNSQESNFPNCLENRIVSISYRYGEAGDGDWECGVSVKCTTQEYNIRNNLPMYLILLGGKSTTVEGWGRGEKGVISIFEPTLRLSKVNMT